jgi:hypothetical protein
MSLQDSAAVISSIFSSELGGRLAGCVGHEPTEDAIQFEELDDW